MKDAELLESLRASLQLGLIQIYSGGAASPERGLVFFGDVPAEILDCRGLAVEQGRGGAEWFLVTDRPRGSEWKDEVLDRRGLWVVEVDELARVRHELEEVR